MSEPHARKAIAPRFELIADHLCLDFINTLDNRPSPKPKECLVRFSDLLQFEEQSGVLSQVEAARYLERSHAMEKAAAQTLRSAIDMREAMFAVFMAVAKRRTVPREDLARVNGAIQYAGQHAKLAPAPSGFTWEFDRVASAERPFDPVLWPIARAAAELLASAEVQLVRTCSAETCQGLFLDISKNHRRRWCSMKLCGNRAKVQKFYARKRNAAEKRS
jgi:predicted RNA-binding Zn ribbon-like protein